MRTRTENIPATMSGIEIKGLQHEKQIREWIRALDLIKEARLIAFNNDFSKEDRERYSDTWEKIGNVDDRFSDLLMGMGEAIGLFTREDIWDKYVNVI